MSGWFESQTTTLAIHPRLPFGSRSCVLFWCTKRRWGGDGRLIHDIHPQKYYFNAATINPDFHDWKPVWAGIFFFFFFFFYPHLHSATLHLAYISWCCLFVSAGAHRLWVLQCARRDMRGRSSLRRKLQNRLVMSGDAAVKKETNQRMSIECGEMSVSGYDVGPSIVIIIT